MDVKYWHHPFLFLGGPKRSELALDEPGPERVLEEIIELSLFPMFLSIRKKCHARWIFKLAFWHFHLRSSRRISTLEI
jgi:hypothetical protein